MHTMDRYFSVDTDNAFTDAVAEAPAHHREYGRAAMDDPADYKARSEIIVVRQPLPTTASPAWASPGLLAPRPGARALRHVRHPHGESLSIMWPAWARLISSGAAPPASPGSAGTSGPCPGGRRRLRRRGHRRG